MGFFERNVRFGKILKKDIYFCFIDVIFKLLKKFPKQFKNLNDLNKFYENLELTKRCLLKFDENLYIDVFCLIYLILSYRLTEDTENRLAINSYILKAFCRKIISMSENGFDDTVFFLIIWNF